MPDAFGITIVEEAVEEPAPVVVLAEETDTGH
jgi:hypothetical protein